MPKGKQKTVAERQPDAEQAYALWGQGNVRAARRVASEILQAEPSPEVREALERLLADSAPDGRVNQITVFAVAVLGVVVLLTRIFD